MAVSAAAPEIALLLDLLDQAYDKKAWHGPGLRGALRGLGAAQASWRPGPRRRSIADIAVHAAYWKYAVRRRLRGDKRGSFPLKGSNWFTLAEPLHEPQWRQYLALLQAQHGALREAVADVPVERLHQVSAGSKWTTVFLITGIAAHDVYHAGQIQLLKRLLRRNAGRT
jgi:uncharacterized damage-inducible protein DinB